MIDFSGISLPFSPGDLLNGGVELLGVIASFVVMALAFVIVSKLIGLIVSSVTGSTNGHDAKRDEHGNRIHFQSKEARAVRDKTYKENGWKRNY